MTALVKHRPQGKVIQLDRRPHYTPAPVVLAPADVDAEQAVLGAILIDPWGMLARVSRILKPEHFTRPFYAAVYREILALAAAGAGVDLVTVSARIDDRIAAGDPDVNIPTPLAEIARLQESTPICTHAPTYAARVREMATKRALMSAAGRIAEAAYDPLTPGGDALASARALLDRMDADVENAETGHVSEALADLVAPRPDGWSTGIGVLDQWMNGAGLIPGKTVVVSGKTGVGKSWCSTMMEASALNHGARVIDFTLEMSRAERIARLGAAFGLGGRCLRLLRSPAVWTEDDHALYSIVCRRIEDLPLLIFEKQRDIDAMVGLVRTYGADVVAIDYYQNLRRPADAENADDADKRLSERIEALAQRERCCVIVVSQLNKGASLKFGAWMEARCDARMEFQNVEDRTSSVPAVKIELVKNRLGPDSQVGSSAEFTMDKSAGKLTPRYQASEGGWQ